MSTAISNKASVEAKWPQAKAQEEAAQAMARILVSAINTLGKYGEEAMKEFDKQGRTLKVQHFKKLGVNSPIDLVKAMAEFDANVLGSKVEIAGDEKQASLSYQSCAIWNAMSQLCKPTAEQEQKMSGHFEACMSELGKEFGFKTEAKLAETGATVTFSK
jgi:hypothetical protein